MNVFLRYAKPIGRAQIVAMIALSAAQYPAEAALVSTESLIGPQAGAGADRARLRELINREDVRAKMEAYGIDSDEALARVDSLTDREIAGIARRLDEMPAGQYADAYGTLFALAVLGIVVLVAAIFWAIAKAIEAASDSSDVASANAEPADAAPPPAP